MTLDQLRSNVSAYIAGLSMGGNNETVTNAIMADVARLSAPAMTAVTPGSEELKRHEADFYLLMRSLLTDVAIGKLGVMSSRANDLLHKLKHLDTLRLAAKPDEDVREATIEECAKIADAVSVVLSEYSKQAKAIGDMQTMYRSNTAWHNTTGIAEAIRALSTTGEPKR